MSLFLKNLPKSFYRAIVSSRPIFNKATSLFSSIASNAQPKLPAFPIARSHHVRTFSLSAEEKRRQILKKYCLYDRWYSTEKQKPKSPKPKSGHVQSGAVTCTVNKGVIECAIDCGKLGKGGDEIKKCQSKEEKNEKSAEKSKVKEEKKDEKKHCPLKEDMKVVCETSDQKKIIAKFKKEEDPKVTDVQAIAGTWVSKKCKKFEFSCCNLKDDEETRPYRLEDGKPAPKSRKTSSKALARKKCTENQKKKKETSGEKKKECKSEKKKECKSEKKKECKSEKKSKKECKKKDEKGQQIKPDQSPLNECIALCKKASKEKTKEKKEEKSSVANCPKDSKTNAPKSKECTKTCKSKPPTKKTKSKSSKKVEKSAKKNAPCKPCTSKKEDKPKKRKSSSKKKKEAKPKDSKGKKSDDCAEGKTKMANSSLVVATYDTVACEDKKTAEMIKKLRKELEECRKAKSSGSKSPCVESPKLTSELPKPKPQEKDVVAGSKSFIKNVCDGIFDKNKKPKDSPGPSKSTPTVKSPKCPTPVRASKSEDCKIKAASDKKEKKGKDAGKKKEEKKDPCPKKEEKKNVCPKKVEKKEEKKDVCPKKEEKKDVCPKKEEKKDACPKKEEKKDVCPKKEEKDLCKKKETKKENVDPCKSLAKDKPGISVCPPKKKKKEKVCSSKKQKKTPKKKKKVATKKKAKKLDCETMKAKSDPCTIPVAEKPVRRTKSESSKPGPGKEEPPDQSPMMQCIALCRKKKKADRPIKGKGIPPRDKKACSNNIETYKKLVEFSDKKSKKEAKDEIKPFIPCMYEEIKPGIRGMDGLKCEEEKKKEKADKEHCN